MSNMANPPREYRRVTRWPRRLSIPVTIETWESVAAEADADELPLSTVAREALAAGLPLVRERNRKRRKRAAADAAPAPDAAPPPRSYPDGPGADAAAPDAGPDAARPEVAG